MTQKNRRYAPFRVLGCQIPVQRMLKKLLKKSKIICCLHTNDLQLFGRRMIGLPFACSRFGYTAVYCIDNCIDD